MSDRTPTSFDDPCVVGPDQSVIGLTVDPARTLAILSTDTAAIARAIAAMANTNGGEIVLGAALDHEGRIAEIAGITELAGHEAIAAALGRIDPPVAHLVQHRVTTTPDGIIGLVRVRLSPSAPHLVTSDGGIYRLGADGVRPIRSRRALDGLYARGRGERERADRQIEAMIEKLVVAHYAFYSLAIVACTHEPSAEPFAAAQRVALLAPADDPFVRAFGLHEHEPKIGPGEVELRTPGEVNAYLRITRGGCVAAGEVQRRPHHEELDSETNIRARLTRLCDSAARLLRPATGALMAPSLFVEGVRGLRLVIEEKPYRRTGASQQDTIRASLAIGDPRDQAYVNAVATEAMERLGSLFPEDQT